MLNFKFDLIEYESRLEQKLNKVGLRNYQRSAILASFRALSRGDKKIIIEMASGTGKTVTMVILSVFLIDEGLVNKVLYLGQSREILYQTCQIFNEFIQVRIDDVSNLKSDSQIVCATNNDLLRKINNRITLQDFNLIICDNAASLKNVKYNIFNELNLQVIGISACDNYRKSWFGDTIPAFRVTLEPNDTKRIITEREILETFFIKFFKASKIDDIVTGPRFRNDVTELRKMKLDLLVCDGQVKYVVEVKTYKSHYIQPNVLDTAVTQINMYKKAINRNDHSNYQFCLILFAEISTKVKSDYYEKYGITIWDISNILYLCYDNQTLINLLTSILSYPINGISPQKPIGWLIYQKNSTNTIAESSVLNEVNIHLEALKNCKSGRLDKRDKKYENICTDIIRYLFGDEFSRLNSQHSTGDNLFRMDMMCSLKGTTAFWKFIIQHYNSKYIVFEYKNYSKQIPQNQIYISEKYLFSAALRNVAIIISRKGFDKNAEKAAEGCLKEHNKLILSINDEDLINMLKLKADGKEPSDYLIDLVDRFLMSISK